MSACIELYGRQCKAVLAIAEWMVHVLGCNVLAVWETVSRLRQSEVIFWVAVEMDVRFCERRASLCLLLGHQMCCGLLSLPTGLFDICQGIFANGCPY